MPESLYSRIVSDEVQEQFAALSGDRNPMHMDVVAARRTQAGYPVVHGVHTMLWALETAAAKGFLTAAPCRLRAKFLKWVYLGDTAEMTLTPGATRLTVSVEGMEVLTVDLTFGVPVPPPAPASAAGAALVDSRDVPLAEALDLNFAALEGHKGEAYTAPSADVRAMFPALCALLGARAVAEIASCSYIVGMEAPGLHSMFSKLDLTVFSAPEGKPDERFRKALHYHVSYLDERFRKGRVTVAGSALSGTLDVFIRVPPVQQAGMEFVAKYVQPGEFAGMNALIIGGSRGLGELTAKLIAAGGGNVTITYALGKDEAEKVAGQIRASGAQAHTLPYDVRRDPDEQLQALPNVPTHLFYFATSVIYKPKMAVLSPQAFADFTQFYLRGFYDLCTALASSLTASTPAQDLRVFYPSTVFLESRPAGMTEYAMAKAAGEQLCVDMNTYLPGVHILSYRLPKLATDQTAGVIPERETDSVDALLPQLRALKDLVVVKK